MVAKTAMTLQEKKIAYEKIQIVKDFILFTKLPAPIQQKAFDDWEKYYVDVKSTVTYAMYQKARALFKAGQNKQLKEHLAEMKQMRIDGVIPELAKPKLPEPSAFYQDETIIKYRNLLQDIRRDMKEGTGF